MNLKNKELIGISLITVIIAIWAAISYNYTTTFKTEKAAFENTLAQNPDSWGAEYNVGVTSTNPIERMEHIKKAYEKAPAGAELAFDFYKSMIDAGEYNAALLVLDKLVEKDKNFLKDRAALNVFLENYEEACKDSKAYVEFMNGDPNALFLHGVCLESNLNWDEAWLVFKTLGEMSRDLNMVNHALSLNKDFRHSYWDPDGCKTVLIIGDSIANGVDSTNNVKSLAARLTKEAENKQKKDDYIFKDYSVNGLRASQILVNEKIEDLIETNQASIVVIVAGVNDAWDQVCAKTIAKHISVIALTCIEKRAKPVIVGPIPVMSVYDRDRKKQEKILAELNTTLKGFCETNDLTFVNIREKLNSVDNDNARWIHTNFGNHLNDEGMEILTEAVFEKVSSKLNERF